MTFPVHVMFATWESILDDDVASLVAMQRQADFLALVSTARHHLLANVIANELRPTYDIEQIRAVAHLLAFGPVIRTLNRQLLTHGFIAIHDGNNVIPSFVAGESGVIPDEEHRAFCPRLRHASSVHFAQESDLAASAFALAVGSHERYDDVIVFVSLEHVDGLDLNEVVFYVRKQRRILLFELLHFQAQRLYLLIILIITISH